MKKIGIFCSASDSIDPAYFDSARQIGQWMGENGYTLVYGGANRGLMECVASSVKSHGGHVVGVLPSKIETGGRASQCPDRIVHVRDLSERKDVMTREADILVALPGGIGTLDEVFHVMAAASVGYHAKRVVFYNERGFYDGLLQMLSALEQKGFAREPFARLYAVAANLDELKEIIRQV